MIFIFEKIFVRVLCVYCKVVESDSEKYGTHVIGVTLRQLSHVAILLNILEFCSLGVLQVSFRESNNIY